MKYQAYLDKVTDDGIQWLVIESDENETKGFFLYSHISQEQAFDTWHKTLDEAFEAAQSQFDIAKNNWKEVE